MTDTECQHDDETPKCASPDCDNRVCENCEFLWAAYAYCQDCDNEMMSTVTENPND